MDATRVRTFEQAEPLKSDAGAVSFPSLGSLVLQFEGAGFLEFKQYKSACGRVVSNGMAVDCSWSRYGYSGGVTSRESIQTLRDFLTQWLDESLDIVGNDGAYDEAIRNYYAKRTTQEQQP